MVTTSGFSSTPVSRALIFGVVCSSLVISITDSKHYLPIQPVPHLWPYLQLSRLFTFQLAYISSTELLFAVCLFYQFRVLERIWGSRKFGSFIIVSWALAGAGTTGLGVALKALSWGWWGNIPPGLTSVVFAVLAVWRREVPGLYGVQVVTGPSSSPSTPGTGLDGEQAPPGSQRQEKGIVLSDKFTTYALAGQLALSQFPYQLLPAFVGWVVGTAWREEILPTSTIRWRMPGWLIGDAGAGKRSRGQYEGLRRRLEEEGGARDGMREVSEGIARAEGTAPPSDRRGVRAVMAYFTGS